MLEQFIEQPVQLFLHSQHTGLSLLLTLQLGGVMKRAVKWTSTVNQVEKSRMVDVDREKVCGVDVDRRQSTSTK